MIQTIFISILGILISTPQVWLSNPNLNNFKLKVYAYDEELKNNNHHWTALVIYNNIKKDNLLLRIHDQCLISELFGSQNFNSKIKIDKVFSIIKDSGMLIYLPHEGKNIGLYNTILTYKLQENGFNQNESFQILNLPIDCRQYKIVKDILDDLEINSVNLITNNKVKIEKLQQLNITINTLIPIY